MGMLKEFREFALRGNVVDLAVAVVIGVAFGKIITSLVDKIIMPLVSFVTGGGDLSSYDIALGEGKDAVMLGIGSFSTAVIDFIIVAFAIFLAVKAMNTVKKRFEKAQEAAAPATPAEDILLLREIRDALKK